MRNRAAHAHHDPAASVATLRAWLVVFAVLAAAALATLAGCGGRTRTVVGQIVYVRGNWIWMVNADGSGRHRTGLRVENQPVWSDDGRWIAFVVFASRKAKSVVSGVYVGEREGGRRHLVAKPQDPGCFTASWSGDDTKFVFSVGGCDGFGSGQMFVVGRNGHDLRALRSGGGLLVPALSPDGERVLATGSIDNYRHYRLWVIDTQTGRMRPVPHAPVDVTYPLGRWAWTRDGRRILYTHQDSLYITDRAGASNHRISPPGLRVLEISQSPDGRWIVYTGGDGKRRNLYVSRIDGSELRHLTTDVQDTAPSWSPDGKQIVFVRTHALRNRWGRPSHLMVMNADGTDLHPIGGSATDVDYPIWLPPH